MDGPWLNDLTARDNRYKFNGIERVTDLGLNMDLAPFRSYDPAIGRWWQADPIAKAWESPYAAMYNSPLNWADGMGDNPSSPGIQGPRAVAQDSTPRTVWNFLTIPKLQYTDEDRIPVLGTQQFTTKITINTGIELWNGGVGLVYGITHPAQAWKGIKGAGSYLWNSPLDQKIDDLGDVVYNSPETIVSLAVPFGAASKVGKLGSLSKFALRATVAQRSFDVVLAFKNAISPFKGQKLTNAGRAATKHPEYFGFESTEALMKTLKTPEAINRLASERLKAVLRNGKMTTGSGGRYPQGWVTFTLKNGNAASWDSSGKFIGFRGLK
jgi:RHS repeat-associated protein